MFAYPGNLTERHLGKFLFLVGHVLGCPSIVVFWGFLTIVSYKRTLYSRVATLPFGGI